MTTFYTYPQLTSGSAIALVLGAELQPGFYCLHVWAVCVIPQSVAATAELLLKAPSELYLRFVTGNDLLHREG